MSFDLKQLLTHHFIGNCLTSHQKEPKFTNCAKVSTTENLFQQVLSKNYYITRIGFKSGVQTYLVINQDNWGLKIANCLFITLLLLQWAMMCEILSRAIINYDIGICAEWNVTMLHFLIMCVEKCNNYFKTQTPIYTEQNRRFDNMEKVWSEKEWTTN